MNNFQPWGWRCMSFYVTPRTGEIFNLNTYTLPCTLTIQKQGATRIKKDGRLGIQ